LVDISTPFLSSLICPVFRGGPQNWSEWFKTNLWSRFYTKIASKKGIDDRVFAEGVIFYNLKRKAEQKTWRAKLRRDMFEWYYSDKIEIFGYDPKDGGRAPSEPSDWD